jgi:aminoglycoside 2'-N-acetyltransferase I
MAIALNIEVVAGDMISPSVRTAILALCRRAYGHALSFDDLTVKAHVIGYYDGHVVSHALWVTRWLQVAAGPLLRTAYVEAVATDPNYQHRGFATQIMRTLAEAVKDYELAALCPAEDRLYLRLGWLCWKGPRFIRSATGRIPTPEETVMILRLPRTPALDLSAPLSVEWRDGELW